jgi:hypothetical protein
MREIPISSSVGGYMYQHVTDWLNKYDNQAERVLKQISGEVAYTGIMIFSAYETLARGVYALVLKGFCHFFIEDSKKKEFTKKQIVNAGQNFLFCASVMGGAAVSLKDNLAKCSLTDQVTGQIINGDTTIDKVAMFYFKTFPKQLRAMGFPVP